MLTALFFVIQGLCFLANLGRGTSESGARHDRIWEEVRSRLGRDTTASGTVFANKYRIWFIGVVAPCFTRCCHVACAMWWIYIEVALAFDTEIHPLKTSKASMIFIVFEIADGFLVCYVFHPVQCLVGNRVVYTMLLRRFLYCADYSLANACMSTATSTSSTISTPVIVSIMSSIDTTPRRQPYSSTMMEICSRFSSIFSQM